MENKSSITALMSAFGRAYHNENSKNPIFKDTVARKLMTDDEYRMIGEYILAGFDFFAPEKKSLFDNKKDALQYLVNTQIAPTPLARAKFCEESLKIAVMTGTKQYVILGAGLDTFALREKELMKSLKVFEVDHPLTSADKQERIKISGFSLPKNLTFVSCDFTKDNLCEKLIDAGYDKTKKTFFSWLGVSYYLDKETIDRFIKNIACICSEGSSLLFDYADCNMFLSDVKRVQNMIAMAKAGGEEMKSSFDCLTIEMMLSKYRFLVYEHLDRNKIQKRYFSGRNDELSAFEHINYALAVLKQQK